MKSRNFPTLRRSKWRLLILLLLPATFATMAGCATTPSTRTVINNCTPWSPIVVSKQDVLTDSTAKQIESHDCIGVRLHCWQPPTPQACQAPPAKSK